MIRAESTDAIGLPVPELCCAESAAPKLVELMSDPVHELPHRSAELPYAVKVSAAGQLDPLALSVAPIVPPLTIRTALSLIAPVLPFLYSHST